METTAKAPTPLSHPGYFLMYLGFRVLMAALWVLPLPLVAWIGRAAGWCVWYLAGSYRRLAVSNVRIAFGSEMTERAQREVAHRHFASLGGNLLCGLKLPLMKEAAIIKRVRVEGLEHARAVRATGKSLLYGIGHLSCWELLAQVPSLFVLDTKPSTVYQPLGNPFINAWVLRARGRLGYEVFSREDGFNGPMRLLRAGNGSLGILIDQHAGDKGIWCPLFDRLASTTPIASLMAIKLHLPLLLINIYDDGLARWRLVITKPVESGESRPTIEGLTAAMNRALEQVIRAAPHNNFWVHNRWKTPSPEFLLRHYHRGIVLPAGYDAARLQRFELIVRSPNWLGDACMAFPAVRALRQGRPDLRLTVFAPAKLAQLWRSLGIVDEIITKDGKEGLFAVARKIKATGRHYDAGILFTNSTRSTLEFWLAGVGKLAGFKGSLRARWLDQIAPEQPSSSPPEHQAWKYLRLARHCGAQIDDPTLFATGAPVTSPGGRIRVGICAGAEYGPAKRWPMDRFAEVANSIPQVEWVLFGAPGEKAQGEQLASMLHVPCTNLVGSTTLEELIQRLRECTLLLTNDTGTMHLAAALGVPVVAIFGSTEPILTGPLGAQHAIVRHHVPCSPCFKRECPFGHYECMTGISSAQVATIVQRRLVEIRGQQ